MSEYQYYELLAIDRPLTREGMSALRALSTRAHITPVSFTNEYQWGDFKGNPDDLMRRFFDAHVYVANWMTAIFMVRLPIEAIPKKTAEAMAVDGVLDLDATKTHWVITWRLDESENCDRFGMEDGRGWMPRLASIRDELLRGDIRSLYIGWLAAVTKEMVDDDALEPLPVEGLGSLTATQQALAEFLEVDENLLAGAGMGSPALQTGEPSQKEMDDWLGELPRSETAKKSRLEREKREQERLNINRRKEREAFLATLAKDFPKAWNVVQQHVAPGIGFGLRRGLPHPGGHLRGVCPSCEPGRLQPGVETVHGRPFEAQGACATARESWNLV
jgi:hypothetical protein